MRPVTRGLRKMRSLLILVTVLLASVASAEDKLYSLTAEQMRQAASEALRIGRPDQALTLSNALLLRDEDDHIAWLVRARAHRDMDAPTEAKAAARQAWRLSETEAQRYVAAMVMAQVLSSSGQKTMAQLWLRRAVQLAPDERLERIAIRDFKYVRAANPWSTRYSFSITPDSNINNGSSSRSSFLNYQLTELLFGEPVEYELSGAALALSGVEYAFGFDTRYRFLQSGTAAHDLFFSFDSRAYTLSDEARAEAPNVSASDFSYIGYILGYGYRQFNFDRRGEVALRLDGGQSWYGGEEYVRFARTNVIQSYTLNPKTRINGRLGGERQWGIRTHDLDTYRADAWIARFLDNGMQLRLAATAAMATSPTDSEEFEELGLTASVVFKKPLFGANVQFGLGYRNRDYEVSPHSPDGREEDRYSAEMTLIFKDIDYYGFNPTMTVFGSAVDSNIGLYDSERLGINFGIQSAF